MYDVPIRDTSIRLGQFLKLAGLVDQGSDARDLVGGGAVLVNGEAERRRGRQLEPGDQVTIQGTAGPPYRVVAGGGGRASPGG